MIFAEVLKRGDMYLEGRSITLTVSGESEIVAEHFHINHKIGIIFFNAYIYVIFQST